MLFTSSKVLPIIYASTSGNVERVVEEVAAVLSREGVVTELHRAEQTGPDIFQTNSRFILATSTWAHGELNPFFVKLYENMKSLDFHDTSAAFIGLGDRRYEPVLFCEGMEILRRCWVERGGQVLGDPLKIQGEPYGVLKTVVEPWTLKLAGLLKA